MGFENTILLIAHFEDSRKNEYTFLFILLYGGGSAAASTGYGNR